jgi:parvulin-like peptidyl-prolyl isomerase
VHRDVADLPAAHAWRPLALLALGAVTGIVLAAVGLMPSRLRSGNDLPSDAVARVNGELIRRDDFERLLVGLASDRGEAIGPEQRRHVLDRLIDEELLIQRGLELGFARLDRRVRGDLTAVVMSAIIEESQGAQPTRAELQAFYDTERAFFAQPGQLRVRQVFCRVTANAQAAAALARADQAATRLRAGEDFEAVRRALGDAELSPLPDTLLPAAKLRDYLGPTAQRAALSLDAGAISAPIRSGTGFHVLQVVERQEGIALPLESIESQVLAEYRRRAGEKALRDYLDELRARADIQMRAEEKN